MNTHHWPDLERGNAHRPKLFLASLEHVLVAESSKSSNEEIRVERRANDLVKAKLDGEVPNVALLDVLDFGRWLLLLLFRGEMVPWEGALEPHLPFVVGWSADDGEQDELEQCNKVEGGALQKAEWNGPSGQVIGTWPRLARLLRRRPTLLLLV